MEYLSLGLILDCVIVVLLVATIIYAVRLSGYLKRFKDNRTELQAIILDLSAQINKANQAVEGLHEAADEAGHDLQQRVNKAGMMLDELDMMIQSGDALANRLEDLAIKNRKIIDGGEGDLSNLQKATEGRAAQEDVEPDIASPFTIRDPEMEHGAVASQSGFTLDNDDVLSEAERDLYDALQKKSKAR